MPPHSEPNPDPSRPRPPVRLSTTPPGGHPDPADAPFALERLASLSHDLTNLLDGSLRCLSIARRSLDGVELDEPIQRARRQVETVYGALQRMADLIEAAMRGSASVVGSPNLSPRAAVMLPEAIAHAAEVCTPEASEHAIAISAALAPELALYPAGPIYSVILNGIRNAVEAIVRAREHPRSGHANGAGGRIEVRAGVRAAGVGPHPDTPMIVIEIADDGAGLPSRSAAQRAFEVGVSTKPGGLGIGLALSREVMRELAGTIELVRADRPANAKRPGAVLRITYPAPRPLPRSSAA